MNKNILDNVEYINTKLSMPDKLNQLAEECAELAQAALKLSRAIRQTNPTPAKPKDIYNNLIEETSDVYLCLTLLQLEAKDEIMESKSNRWIKRLDDNECE